MKKAFVAFILALAAGCSGETAAEAERVSAENIEMVEPLVKYEADKEVDLDLLIQAEISRLTEWDWRLAKQKLMRIGKPAVPELIKLLESPDRTATLLPRSAGYGSYTLGEIAYDVLTEMMTSFSDYKGKLPPKGVEAWTAWWQENEPKVEVKYLYRPEASFGTK